MPSKLSEHVRFRISYRCTYKVQHIFRCAVYIDLMTAKCVKMWTCPSNWLKILPKYRIFSNLIRTSFCRFLKRKKKLVRGSNPHLSFIRPLRAAPSEVAQWVSAAWKAIPESIIFRSFKKCCISNALDGSVDDFRLEDDGEDKDDSDWVTDNDSVTSDFGDSDE